MGTNGELGFWAELYVIKDGNYETFYRNTHPVGLGEIVEFPPEQLDILRSAPNWPARVNAANTVLRETRAEHEYTFDLLGSRR